MKSIYKLVNNVPLVLKVAYFLQKNKIKGGYYLEEVARIRGWLNVMVRVNLNNGVKIDIPPYKVDSYHIGFIQEYEEESLALLNTYISKAEKPVFFLDCGADIGLFAALAIASSRNIEKVIAFEPNLDSFDLLVDNLKLLPVLAEAKSIAVADFNGQAELKLPEHDSSSQAAYISPLKNGDISVIQIDDLGLPDGSRIVCKIDVEGGELAVINGCKKTLTSSESFFIVFEAHREQVKRTGIDPSELINVLKDIKECEVVVAEAADQKIDLKKPFFEQYTELVLYNICVFSK